MSLHARNDANAYKASFGKHKDTQYFSIAHGRNIKNGMVGTDRHGPSASRWEIDADSEGNRRTVMWIYLRARRDAPEQKHRHNSKDISFRVVAFCQCKVDTKREMPNSL